MADSRTDDTYSHRIATAHLPDRSWLASRYTGDGAPVDTIAAEAGMSREAVYAALHHHHIPLRGQAGSPDWGRILTADYLGEALEAGRSLTAIAADAGCHRATVREWASRHGLYSDLDETVAVRITQVYEAGATIIDVAESEGWHRSTARRKLLQAGVTMRRRGRRRK